MEVAESIKAALREVQDFPKPGIVFKDITPLLAQPELMRAAVRSLADRYRSAKLDAIAACEARGFIFGSALALELGVPFIPVRKAGKLPYKTLRQDYALEYGHATLEMHIDAVQPGWNVLIHDDVLATGGTAAATAGLIQVAGAHVAGFAFIINLSFLLGGEKLKREFNLEPFALVTF
ncbi:adenine phosphoribosyltransferase [Chryseolinea sp. T2]|uniref:adenine phosphoribosyltransferase n=1 Tax=Chryseolinea sp. T2 TaxID=3129255 RepID=UPI00307875ED